MFSTSTRGLVLLHLVAIISVVVAKVEIRPEPKGDVGLMVGKPDFFQCLSVESKRPEKLVWLDPNGNEISNDPSNPVYTVAKKTMAKLELKNPTKQHEGIYKCVSKNEQNVETSSAVFKLHVFHPTTVQGKNFYQEVEGRPVRMECAVTADQDTNVDFTWKYNEFDLSREPRQYRIETNREKSPTSDAIRYVSRMEIINVTKDHDGTYVCAVDTLNKFLTDSQELKITLRVQYKPRFDQKTPNFIWVSEEAVQQGGPLTVNISCIVYADPIAQINWYSFDNRPVIPNKSTGNVKAQITGSDNMSILMLAYRNIDEIRHPRPNSRIKYRCTASNAQGTESKMFEIKVGKIPDSPQVLALDFKDGLIHLHLNESKVEPPIDVYRLEIDQQAHLFNKTSKNSKENKQANNTYTIEMILPKGEHKVNIFAHNPVGWSEQPYSDYFLTVVSSSRSLSSNSHMIISTITTMLVLVRMLA